MPRIVKEGAEGRWFTDSTLPWYSDTTEIKPGWRPDNIGEIKYEICRKTGGCTEGDCEACSQVPNFNETWEACLKALGEI